MDDLDIYQRYVPPDRVAPGLFPTGPPGWTNVTGSGATVAVERFAVLQRTAQHVALFCLDPTTNGGKPSSDPTFSREQFKFFLQTVV